MDISKLTVQRLALIHQEKIHQFLVSVFHVEQNIPLKDIPLKTKTSFWWGITNDSEELFGTVASWKKKNEWHWGRFAVSPQLRGKGLGKVLAEQSLNETFNLGAEKIIIDARETTVNLMLKFGGSIAGATTMFSSESITPMVLEKKNFKKLK